MRSESTHKPEQSKMLFRKATYQLSKKHFVDFGVPMKISEKRFHQRYSLYLQSKRVSEEEKSAGFSELNFYNICLETKWLRRDIKCGILFAHCG